jgi:hypothetical protein
MGEQRHGHIFPASGVIRDVRSGVIAVLALALFVVSVPMIGAALFSLLLLGLFGLALVGVLSDRS